MAEPAPRDAFRWMIQAVIEVLNRSGLRYDVLGCVAANALARPRTTLEIVLRGGSPPPAAE